MTCSLRRPLRLGLLALLSLATGPWPARADTAPPALIIVDGSGSMWGKMEGDETAKFYATRDFLRELLARTSPQSRVGLASFGHRRKGDCGDVEVIAPVEAGGSEGVAAALEKLSPKGKGPLALSLREAAKTMGLGASGTIILVHDNLDNCQQDVCAAATEVAKSNPALKVHVVSLGLEKPDRERIQCVAKATGGRHFDAASQPAIAEALAEAFKLAGLDAAAAPAPAAAVAPPPAPAAPAPQGPPGLRLTASMADGGPIVDSPLSWRIARADAAAASPPLVERKAREINETLEPGKYTVSVTHGLVTRRFDLDVGTAGPTVTRLNLDAGTITIAASASKLGDKLTAPVMTIAPRTDAAADPTPSAPLWIGRESTAELVVPASPYAIEVTDGLARTVAIIEVKPGTTLRSDLVLETGRLDLSATGFEGGPPLDSVVYLIAVDDADAPQGRREIARSTAPNPGFTLQAGTYYVTGRLGQSEVRERVAISSGDIVKKNLVLGIARLTVEPALTGTAASPSLPIVTRITEAAGAKALVGHSTAAKPVFVLGAGRYRIESQVGTLNIRASQIVNLEPGKDLSASVKLEAGEISIAGLSASEPAAAVRAALRDAKGRIVWRSRQGDQLKTLAAPGQYVLQIETAAGRTEHPVTLKAGEARVVDVATP